MIERAVPGVARRATATGPVGGSGDPPAAGSGSPRSMPDRPAPPEPRSRPWIWAVYLFLFAASVPWYLPAGSPPRLWLGLPHWVVISLAAYLAVAVFTAWVVARYWPAVEDGGRDAAQDGEDGAGGAA